MGSSSNTFGTFLQTYSTLEKQGAETSAQNSVTSILRNIAQRKQNFIAVKDLVTSSDLSKEEVLSTLISGSKQGLWTIGEEQGEAVANLTNLGKLFVD